MERSTVDDVMCLSFRVYRKKQEAFVMFYTRWRPSCLPTRKCRIVKLLIRGIIDVQNMKLCYVRFGKVGGCISYITRDDHVEHVDHVDHVDGDHDDDDDSWLPSHVGKALTELDSHESDEYTWLTGRGIGKTSASIGASLLFPFLSARECKIWAGFWAGQVCWQPFPWKS